jgi:septal ring factor EnvC (AmiA/AmiB activator)
MSNQVAADVDEPEDFDVVRAHDLSPRLEFLSQSRQRWRRSALIFVSSSIFLFILSCVQFWGTFEACRLVHNARKDADRANNEAAKHAKTIEHASEELERVSFYHATLQEELKALHAEQRQEMTKLRNDIQGAVKQRDNLTQAVEQLQKRLRDLEKKNE